MIFNILLVIAYQEVGKELEVEIKVAKIALPIIISLTVALITLDAISTFFKVVDADDVALVFELVKLVLCLISFYWQLQILIEMFVYVGVSSKWLGYMMFMMWFTKIARQLNDIKTVMEF